MSNQLITADEIGQAADNIMADWPQGRFLDLKRLVKDTLHDCQQLADHYEDAARVRAFASGSAAVRSGIGGLVGDLKPLGVGSRAVANHTEGTQRLTEVAHPTNKEPA